MPPRQRELSEYEPALILFVSSDGTGFIIRLATQGAAPLAPGGLLMSDLGAGQGSRIVEVIAGTRALRLIASNAT